MNAAADPAVRLLKRSLVGFWAVWFSLVAATNGFDLSKTIGLLPASWPCTSGNFQLVADCTARYDVPHGLNFPLFAVILLWETSAALAFWRAWRTYRNPAGLKDVHTAFTVSLLLWAAFMLNDELFIQYQIEGTHLRLFIAQLATLLAIHLVPETSAGSIPVQDSKET
jgi:hypothetical protein